ncbi:MAG: hypothetical protein AAGJ46_10870 [Planctomycetota bacterium]
MVGGGNRQKPWRWLYAKALVLTLPALALTGCGNGLARVDGQITIDGQPLTLSGTSTARVYFYPKGGAGVPAVGLVDQQGRYDVRTGSQRGVAPGSYSVAISATEVIPAKQAGVPPSGRALIDRRYADPSQSGFRVDVASGGNSFDFDIEGSRTRLSQNG